VDSLSEWDDDNPFGEFFRNIMRFMGDGSLYRPPRGQGTPSGGPREEEILQFPDALLLVMELGPEFTEENVTVELIERNGRRILEVKSFVNNFVRRYGLSDDMTGAFDWSMQYGVIEIRLARQATETDLK
jgi:hypothetical protein